MRIVTKPKKPYVPKRPPKENPAPFIELTPFVASEEQIHVAEAWAKVLAAAEEPDEVFYWRSNGG